jgi:hypothetical protein
MKMSSYENEALSDGLRTIASENDDRQIRGDILKFADWQWTTGRPPQTLKTEGLQLAVEDARIQWVKWIDDRIVDTVRCSGRVPDRDELGDTDQAMWPRDEKTREPKDPWVLTRYVDLVELESCQSYTFVTATYGGRNCVGDLADQIRRKSRVYPGARPVVMLDAKPMQTQYGRKSQPFLRIVGWVSETGEPLDTSAPAKAVPTPATPKAIAAPVGAASPAARTPALAGSARGDMNDEIPF